MAELLDLRRTTTDVALDAVRVPVVMGAGELSRPDLRTTAATLRDRLPDAWMIEIAGAGHGAHLSHADEFARYVRACVTRATYADDALAGAGPTA
jgi:pimeloyl-ACP methyl ester carboxylesterase